MSIKKIKECEINISKEEWKKRIVSVCVLQLGVVLTLSSVPISKVYENYKEEQRLEQEKIEEQRIAEERSRKDISLLYCKVLVENYPDGSVRHHFVNDNGTFDYISVEQDEKYSQWNYEYKGITDENFVIPYFEISYKTTDYYGFCEIPETNGQYIFDYNVPYFVMDAEDLALPNGYSISALYSINDLEKLEKELDTSIYENYDTEFKANMLLLVDVNGEYMCFDFARIMDDISETTNKEDVTKLKNVYYVPCVNNNLLNLKISSGMSAVEERQAGFGYLNIFQNWKYEDITSLDESVRNDYRGGIVRFHNLNDYLTEEQQYNRTITIEEINKILDKLNEEDKKLGLER